MIPVKLLFRLEFSIVLNKVIGDAKISEKHYLDGWHCNIPLKDNWNDGLVAGMQELAEQLQKDKPSVDVHEVTTQRIDDLKEYGGQGDIGYDYPSTVETGYYYIDISTKAEESRSLNEAYKTLNIQLNTYIDSENEYTVVRSSYYEDVDEQGYSSFNLRAYFVKNSD
jgi:hypothetical protein